MRRGNFALLAGVLLVCGAQANILIDDFTTGFDSGTTSTDFYYSTGAGGALGGVRTVNHAFVGNPLNRPISTDVNAGVPGNMFIEAGSGVNGYVVVAWGGALTGAPSGPGLLAGTDFVGLGGIDLSGEAGIQVDYINNDQASTQFVMQIFDTANNAPNSAFFNVAPGNGSIFLPFATLNGAVNLSSVDLVVIGAFLPTGNDVTLTRVEAVPEPATMTILGLGIAGLAARRRLKA